MMHRYWLLPLFLIVAACGQNDTPRRDYVISHSPVDTAEEAEVIPEAAPE